jgi:8-oxo-dGTP pyrophosphatase MutT (NUDIX family)
MTLSIARQYVTCSQISPLIFSVRHIVSQARNNPARKSCQSSREAWEEHWKRLSIGLCYNRKRMDTNKYDTHKVLSALRTQLEPLEKSAQLVDTIEGSAPQARKAAVLVPLFEQDGVLNLTFIRRATSLRAHSGEIAFPGGSVDPTDDSLVFTALREAQEEIGLEPGLVEPLGVLAPVFTVVSNFLITPVVAHLPRGLGKIDLQSDEVAELLTFPLHLLADPEIMHTEVWKRNGTERTVYFYDYGGYRIWGATGRILNSLLMLLRGNALPLAE